MTVPNLTLNNGIDIPQLGFGVFQVPDAQTEAAVSEALAAGYRSIDTAAIYGNERGVGQAIAKSGIAREELFITTKLWNSDQGRDTTRAACEASLEKLGLDHVDLYLIHWPTPAVDKYAESWEVMEELYAAGAVRAIGLSNFLPDHLRRIIDLGGTVPAVDQIELHPALHQADVTEFAAKHDIAVEAWSPLARGGLLDNPVLVAIAERLARTPAQVILRWHLQQGRIVIPKSVTPSRIRENFALFDFELSIDDLAAIDALETPGGAGRIGPHPAEFNV
jgi:2,5-diketo-D-gluconate reductase A